MAKISDTQLRILEKQQISCRDVARLLCDYVEGDLTTTLNARLAAHIQVCAGCQGTERSYKLPSEIAAQLRDRPVPRDVQNRLRKALNEKLGLDLPLVR